MCVTVAPEPPRARPDRADEICGGGQLVRSLVRDDGDAHGELESVEAAECVEVGRVVARVEGAAESARPAAERRPSLVRVDRRTHLQHAPPPPRPQSLLERTVRDGAQLRLGRATSAADR